MITRPLALAALFSAALLAGPAPARAGDKPPEYTFDPQMAKQPPVREVTVKNLSSDLHDSADLYDDPTRCWSITTTRSRGLWPYARAVHLYTLWCSRSGSITYRESSAWPSTDFLCSASDLWWGKVGGGAGWTFVDVQAQANFACHSPWWFDWHDSLMQRIRYHGNGWYETIAYQ